MHSAGNGWATIQAPRLQGCKAPRLAIQGRVAPSAFLFAQILSAIPAFLQTHSVQLQHLRIFPSLRLHKQIFRLNPTNYCQLVNFSYLFPDNEGLPPQLSTSAAADPCSHFEGRPGACDTSPQNWPLRRVYSLLLLTPVFTVAYIFGSIEKNFRDKSDNTNHEGPDSEPDGSQEHCSGKTTLPLIPTPKWHIFSQVVLHRYA